MSRDSLTSKVAALQASPLRGSLPSTFTVCGPLILFCEFLELRIPGFRPRVSPSAWYTVNAHKRGSGVGGCVEAPGCCMRSRFPPGLFLPLLPGEKGHATDWHLEEESGPLLLCQSCEISLTL